MILYYTYDIISFKYWAEATGYGKPMYSRRPGGDCPSGALRQSLCQALTPGQHRAGTAFKTKKFLDSGESMLCAVWQSLLLLFSSPTGLHPS